MSKSTVGLCGDGINKLHVDIGQSSRYYLQHNCKDKDQGEHKVILHYILVISF